MKTKLIPTIFLTALMLAGAIQLSAQISGQVINFHFNRYNSAPNGSKVTVHDGENLGTLQWKGWTPGNEYQASAGFGVDVTGTPADGYLPSRLSFYTGGSGLLERMTILENGYLGIGLSNPAELVDINGNVIVRGTRLSLGLGSSFGNGGEAMTHSNTDCTGAPLPDEVLTLNNGGGFPGGVYVEGSGGLHVCSTLDAECLNAENNVVSENGNVVALGGAAIATPCVPGDGDFIAEGANGDFIARHGHVIAEEGNVTARQNITSQVGNITATAGNVTANIDVIAQTGNVDAQAGNVIANGNVTAETGNVVAQLGNVTANGNVTAETGNVTANVDVIAQTGNVDAQAGSVIANGNVTAETGNVVAQLGNVTANFDVSAGRDVLAGDDVFVADNLGVGLNTDNLAVWPDGYRLAVAGNIMCEEVRVELQGSWPDYVFSPGYQLMSLPELEKSIQQNGHLPNVPSATAMEADGLKLGEMQRIMIEKIEELTLYVIQQQKDLEALKAENEKMKRQLEAAVEQK